MLEATIGQLKIRTQETAGIIAEPFLLIHGAVAYLRTLKTQLAGIIKRR
jgi:hypothetical protein